MRITGFLLLLCVLYAPVVVVAKPLSAFVESEEVGQAILLNRLGSCYGITPAHVIDGGFFATVVGGLPSAPQGDADVLMTFGYDLALMRVTGGVEAHCVQGFKKAGNLDTVFAAATVAHLLTVRSDGSVAREQVTITDTGMLYVYVKPMPGGEPLMKGMSGSLLEVADKPAGMLMSVDPETGNGKVLRYDRVTETIAPFFGDSNRKAKDDVGSGTPSAKGANLAVAVSSWSSPPLDAQSRALNLIDGNRATQWYALADGFPIDVEIKLSDDKAKVLNQVELVSAGVVPQGRVPKDFEIMVSTKSHGGWMSLSSGTLFARDESTVVKFAPVRARRLLLRIYSNWGDVDAIGLSEVRLQ